MTAPIWHEAASFAARAHAGQTRRDERTPYIAHPMRVALLVLDRFGCDDEVAIAIALLHDVIEDTPVDHDELAEAFSVAVADGVAALSKDARLPEAARDRAYDEAIAAADWRVRLVKLADTCDNAVDRAAADPATSARAVEKLHRAIAIAEAAADPQPTLARAIAVAKAVAETPAQCTDRTGHRRNR